MLCRNAANRRVSHRLAGIAAAFLFIAAAADGPIAVQFDSGSYKVVGWRAPDAAPSAGWVSVFAIYAGDGDVPPLLGKYAVEGGMLVFHPKFPRSPGVRYRAVFHSPGGGPPIQKIFQGPPVDTTRLTRVTHVYPSSAVLPSNQLRLYIYFSAPMSQGEAGGRVRLLDMGGKELPGVFLPGEELWDPQFQRLTMTFDPGRIKRGLTSNQSMGPPITEGKSYTLVIDRDWPDARGVPMIESFRKPFRAGPALRVPPDPKQWRINPPKTGSMDALSVDFPTPMNYPLLLRMLQVAGARGIVAGAVSVDRDETRWQYTPREAWKPGGYRLIADTGIEDLAGNHIGQAFDIDVFEHVTEHLASTQITLSFTVR